MRSNGWNSLGVSSGSFFRSRGLGSGERMLLHPLRVGSTIAITAHRQRPRWACVKYLTTCPRSRHLNPPSLSISPSDLPIPSPHAPHVHTPRCAALSAPAGGVCCSHPHIQSPHRALPPSAGRLASRRVPPARGSIGCPSQYFSKSLVTCAMVLPLVSGSLLKVNHPKKKVRPTKIR